MSKKILCYFALTLLLLLSNSSGNSATQLPGKNSEGQTGTREKLIVASGTVTMDLIQAGLEGFAPRRKNPNGTACVSKWAQIPFLRSSSLTRFCGVLSPARWG